MAADNRNFVNKFANEGGGDVLVEDKRLEELKGATAKTASQISTSTDYVPLQDTDGNLVKINPASFEEAVRNVLGSLLANNDKGTTISAVPALSGSGASLDFGSVTPANLASVLGVNNLRKVESVTKNHVYKIATLGRYKTLIILITGYRQNNVNSWFFLGRIYNQTFTCDTFIKRESPDLYYKFNGEDLEIYARANFDYPSIAYLQLTRESIQFIDCGTDTSGLTPFYNE